MPATLELDHVCKSYSGTVAVHDFSRSIAPGTILGLLGPADGRTLRLHSTFSTNNAPIDCNVVKTQAAGKSDSQIAADLSAASNQAGIQQTQITVADVAACHGGETSGNKSAEMIPAKY
jgi:ABC-type uncharacterized transport system ATPase subunit